jgi:hypothetical protein
LDKPVFGVYSVIVTRTSLFATMDAYIDWNGLASQTVAALMQRADRKPFVEFWGQERVSNAERAIAVGNYEYARRELLFINKDKAPADTVRNALDAVGCYFLSEAPFTPTGFAWSCFTADQRFTTNQPAGPTKTFSVSGASMYSAPARFPFRLSRPAGARQFGFAPRAFGQNPMSSIQEMDGQEMDCQEMSPYGQAADFGLPEDVSDL